MLWFFGVLAVGGLYLVVHAAIYAANIGFVVVATGPAVITGALAFTSWYARREAREGLARADFNDLAAANEREEQLGT